MASKINDLAAVTVPLATDITNIVNSPFIPGSDKKITLANLFQGGAIDWKTTGKLALGSDGAFQTGNYWNFAQTITDFTGATNWYGMLVSVTPNPTVDLMTQDVSAGVFEMQNLNTSTHNYFFLNGVTGLVRHNGSGTVTNLLGATFVTETFGTGNTTNQYGVNSNSHSGATSSGTINFNVGFYSNVGNFPGSSSTITSNAFFFASKALLMGSINNNYGILLEDMNFGINSWAIKTGLGLVSFGDNVQTTGSLSADAGLIVGGVFSVDNTGSLIAAGLSEFLGSLVVDNILTTEGNLHMGTGAPDSSAVNVFSMGNGSTPPAGSVNLAQLYAHDISGGNTTLAVYTEQTIANDVGLVSTNSITIFWNGAKYKIPLISVP